MNYNNRCPTVQKDRNEQSQRRIFGFSPHAKPARLHVGENVLHDLPEVGGTESVIAQIVAVAPEKYTARHFRNITRLCLIKETSREYKKCLDSNETTNKYDFLSNSSIYIF